MKKASIPLILVVTALSLLPNALNAQTEKAAVQKVIETMFDGMRAGDSSMVHTAFTDEAVMQTIAANREGQVTLRDGKLIEFLNAVGTAHDQLWDERILNYEIKIDGAMASVWTPYEFYAGERFLHCGVNSFQLMKGKEGWKIIYLVDTRRKEGCQ